MSCLNFNKLLPATKAWKLFTDKVQSKLHKLNRSKTIKKPTQSRYKNKPGKRISWPTLGVQRKRFKPKPKPPSWALHLQNQRRPSPVYIDRLFIEPVSAVKQHQQTSIKAAALGNKETPSSSGNREENAAAPKEEDSADDMWESLVLASPQMDGINERAEEFIARFRAEMRLQERLARRL